MDSKLLTFVFISFMVYVIKGQEYKCVFLSNQYCIVNHTLGGAAGGYTEDVLRMEYDCNPTNLLSSCSDLKSECDSYLLNFTSPLEGPSNTTLKIAYLTEEGNYNRTFDIGLQESYSTEFNISNGYTMEFQCQQNQNSQTLKYVFIDNIQVEVKCPTECYSTGGKSNAAIFIFVPILLTAITAAIALLIRRQKRIKAKEKAKFDRENPDYQSLKRDRTSRHFYQFPSLWQKRNRRKPSSASEEVYEVCGKVVEQQTTQDNASSDYDYAYARTVAGRLPPQNGFEDSGGYLKPVVEELDEEAYLKPSPSASRNSKLDANNLDENDYLKPSPKINTSSGLRDSKTETEIESDDDSDYEYVVPNDVMHEAPPTTKRISSGRDENNGSAPKGKPVIPKKPHLQVTASYPSVCTKSSPVQKRPQPSPRSRKRESAPTNNDYLSVIELETS